MKNKIPNLKDKKIICIHLRNEKFYSETGLISRNADFLNYYETIKFLIERGFFIIKFTDQLSSFKDPNYFELETTNSLNQCLQVYLVSKCEFFIVTASGPSFLANLFKNLLFVQIFPSLSNYWIQ